MAIKKNAKVKRAASKSVAKPTTKKTSAKTTTKKTAAKSAGTRGGATREVNPETGFAVGTDQDAIALTFLEGGASRSEIVEKVSKKIEAETKNGTPKQIAGMCSGVLSKMIDAGYEVDSHFIVTPPTPQSKRRATAARKKREGAVEEKVAATPAKKKAVAKKGKK